MPVHKIPQRDALQASLAALEGGKYGICYSSGLAAMDAVIKLLQSGDEVLCGHDLYGGSYRLLVRVYGPMGIKSSYIDMNDLDLVRKSIRPETKMICCTRAPDTSRITDIKAICDIAREHGIPVCVDNTFASPYLQNPLALGGHHCSPLYHKVHCRSQRRHHGRTCNERRALAERLKFLQNASGAGSLPYNCLEHCAESRHYIFAWTAL